MSGVPFFARRFVAGTRVDEAVQAVRALNAAGIDAALDILGENVRDEAAARAAAAAYRALAETIRERAIRAYLSIKLTMLGLDISTELAEELLDGLLAAGRETGAFVRIDMEGSAYTQRTIELFLRARAKYEGVGIVLQAYLHRTAEDLERVLAAEGSVRLCKGAYKEPPSIALRNMNEIRRNFLRLAERLIERGRMPAFATHDDRLLEPLKTMTAARPRDSFEFQMLYGLRRPTWRRLVGEGYRLRIYVPYGTAWRPYFVRRLRERKENVLFVLRNLFRS